MTTQQDRRLVLRAAPFRVTATVPDETTGRMILERFGGPHVFAGADPAGVELLLRHQPGPVGTVLKLVATERHLVAHVDVEDDRTWQLWRSGALPGASVGFTPLADHWVTDRDTGRPVLERIRVDLREVSLVDRPAYQEARVIGTPVDIEREKIRMRQTLNRGLRALGRSPVPLVPPPSARAAPPHRQAGGDQVHFTAPSGRVLAVH